MLGLFKKVFLADRLAEFVDPVFHNPQAFDAFTHCWAVLAYAAQIYCDFSGYSDLAIGCAKWLGFELPQNFNLPYISSSIGEFWRRWHISLSTWIRDYLYIPLGGSRGGTVRTYFNLITAMTLCGLWHGASWHYILWGFYNGILLALHRLYDRALAGRSWAERMRGNPLFHLGAIGATFFFVAIGLVMVRSESWAGCWLVERSLAGWSGSLGLRAVPAWAPLLVGMVAVGHVVGGLRARWRAVFQLPPLLRAGAYVTAVALVIALGPSSTKAFIYFQF